MCVSKYTYKISVGAREREREILNHGGVTNCLFDGGRRMEGIDYVKK